MFHPLSEEFYGNEETCHRGVAVNKAVDTVNLYFLFINFFLYFLLLVIVFFLFCFFHSCPSALIMIYTAFSDSLLSGYICTPPAPPERLCNDDDSLRRLSFTSLRHFYTANNDQKDTMTLSKIRHNTYSYLHHKL